MNRKAKPKRNSPQFFVFPFPEKNSGKATGLDKRGHAHTRQHAHETVTRHGAEDVAHLVASQFLKPLGHNLHSVQKEAQGADET